MEDEAEGIDVGALHRLRGEDVVSLKGDAGGKLRGNNGVELGFEARKVLDDAFEVGVLGGEFDGEMADGAAELQGVGEFSSIFVPEHGKDLHRRR